VSAPSLVALFRWTFVAGASSHFSAIWDCEESSLLNDGLMRGSAVGSNDFRLYGFSKNSFDDPVNDPVNTVPGGTHHANSQSYSPLWKTGYEQNLWCCCPLSVG
jgi:hypothetical protein